MSPYLDRLRQGKRCWTAEFVLRTLGILLLAGCHKLALAAHRITTTPPHHPARMDELALCAAIFLLLTSGLTLTTHGPGLLRHVSTPSHSHWY